MRLQAKYSNLKHWKSDITGVFLPKNPEKLAIFGELIEIFDDLPKQLLKTLEFSGEENAFVLIHGNSRTGSQRVALLGIGELEQLQWDTFRRGGAKLLKTASSAGFQRISMIFPEYLVSEAFPENRIAEAITEGIFLADYKFDKYRKPVKKKTAKVEELTFITPGNPGTIADAMKKAAIVCSAVAFTRDLANAPGNELTPNELSKRAAEMCRKRSIKCTVLNETRLKTLKMGGILGVSRGSAEPPRMVVMEHKPAKAKNSKPLVLVGKGLTFDAGGISIKPAAEMDRMKFDMCGGAAVIGIMQAIADLKIPRHVIGIVPSSENLLGSRAYKPGDVLTMYSGKTVEIINTDAEGRLILADALAYAQRFKPGAIVDFATLTGHCVVALGHHGAGMMGTDSDMKQRLTQASHFTAEKVWELPLWPEFDRQIKSHIADVKNVGGRPGGASTAAAFLKNFVGDYPWIHLDIAGTANSEEELPYTGKLSATGYGVRLMIEVLRHW